MRACVDRPPCCGCSCWPSRGCWACLRIPSATPPCAVHHRCEQQPRRNRGRRRVTWSSRWTSSMRRSGARGDSDTSSMPPSSAATAPCSCVSVGGPVGWWERQQRDRRRQSRRGCVCACVTAGCSGPGSYAPGVSCMRPQGDAGFLRGGWTRLTRLRRRVWPPHASLEAWMLDAHLYPDASHGAVTQAAKGPGSRVTSWSPATCTAA